MSTKAGIVISLGTSRSLLADQTGNNTQAEPGASFCNPGFQKRLLIASKALAPGSNGSKLAHIQDVASEFKVSISTIYRIINKFVSGGEQSLVHSSGKRGRVLAWTPEALEFWLGLFLKREHRKISRAVLYAELVREAKRRGWKIGSYRNACLHLKLRVNAKMSAYRDGGSRALDNALPPILRSYSDLDPFEKLVGDQHRFDFWVLDSHSGEVFRPEAYAWIDLRTRLFYGLAIGRKYDSDLMVLALYFGERFFGHFEGIYTDNGKPEISKRVSNLMEDLKGLDIKFCDWQELPDGFRDHHIGEPEEVKSVAHIKARPRNAKAKPIERFFSTLERLLVDMGVPGYCKDLSGSKEMQEVDQRETTALAHSGKLLTFEEFMSKSYEAMQLYNNRPHRGVLQEWVWTPKPKEASPLDCLKACEKAGWEATHFRPEILDLLFLPKATRKVDRGRIRFRGQLYEHEKLGDLHGRSVVLRYNPYRLESVLVFTASNSFICRAETVEYSSMKDSEIIERKIREKAERKRQVIKEYKKLTAGVPDIRSYSTIPALERPIALIEEGRRKKALETRELYRVPTLEELQAERREIEEREAALTPLETVPSHVCRVEVGASLPKRPPIFLSRRERFEWLIRYEMKGGKLNSEDLEFKRRYEGSLEPEELEYYQEYLRTEAVSL